jgi:hypothetical protein
MLAERYLKRRHAEGKAEGKIEGQEEERKLWVEWNNRRLKAEAEGEPFDDPPPDED